MSDSNEAALRDRDPKDEGEGVPVQAAANDGAEARGDDAPATVRNDGDGAAKAPADAAIPPVQNAGTPAGSGGTTGGAQAARKPKNLEIGVKKKGKAKTDRIPIKIVPLEQKLKKPEWIRAKIPQGPQYAQIKKLLRSQRMHTVCEEASCPNIGECFSHGTASFMIMGDICTRRCPFCDVGHGRPLPLDEEEPKNLAETVAALSLRYVVVTSVDRDDLRDGGAGHYAACIRELRKSCPDTKVEILVPDFRGRLDRALEILRETPPDVMNHNLETAPALYRKARPGADYGHSLRLLSRYKELKPDVVTKSGIMVGLGETDEEIVQVMKDLREHDVDMITIGQYLQPSIHHLPVLRYVSPARFAELEALALEMGFKHAAVGAMVRSSYHADTQAKDLIADGR